MIQKRLIFIAFLVLGSAGLQAQEAIPASGGEASGLGGSVSYTVGQAAYSNYSGSQVSVTEGVQQPYEIYVVTAANQLLPMTLSFKAYPNPATDYLILQLEGEDNKCLTYLFCDINGKIIGKGNIQGKQTTIPMGIHKSGNYLLQVLYRNRGLQTFKIVKR